MMQVQAMATLILIDGITYQIVFPAHIIAIQAKQALMMAQEFEGAVLPCKFASIRPMECEGMPFNITNSKGDKK